jgi:hypothetical protein
MASRTKVAVRVGSAVVLICLIIGIVAFLRYLADPASGTIAASKSDTAAPVTPPAPLITVRGTYATFQYPNTLHPLQQQAPGGQELAAYSYGKRDTESWELAITINRLADPTLKDDSGYNYRVQKSSQYTETIKTINNSSVVIMTDSQAPGFSKVAFLIHGDMSADISLYGDDQDGVAGLADAFSQVLNSWHWNE